MHDILLYTCTMNHYDDSIFIEIKVHSTGVGSMGALGAGAPMKINF